MIKLLTDIAAPTWHYRSGTIVSLDEATESVLVQRGQAEYVKIKVRPAEVRPAEVRPVAPEISAQRPPKVRRKSVKGAAHEDVTC